MSNLIGFITTFASCVAFATNCKKDLPDSWTATNSTTYNIEWKMGGCFVCLIIATVLKIVDAVIHVITPTPESRWQPMALKPDQGITDYMMPSQQAPKPQVMGKA